MPRPGWPGRCRRRRPANRCQIATTVVNVSSRFVLCVGFGEHLPTCVVRVSGGLTGRIDRRYRQMLRVVGRRKKQLVLPRASLSLFQQVDAVNRVDIYKGSPHRIDFFDDVPEVVVFIRVELSRAIVEDAGDMSGLVCTPDRDG